LSRAIGVDISFFFNGAVVTIVELVRSSPEPCRALASVRRRFPHCSRSSDRIQRAASSSALYVSVLLNVATLIIGLARCLLTVSNRGIA
jgi:hypothetical protein